ncbi:MAG TPA: phosphatidylserine decarboxylase family protein [Methylomirabilota bacterium]|jgi:phosphatidylserine decarboxylase|nr:phosphatidylserine decarboxylase family protein [Methylomirabilota bacterium]
MSRAERNVEAAPAAGPVAAGASGARSPRRRLVPIASEGWPFILVPLVVALSLAWLGWVKVGLLPFLVAAFMAYFFRDPERTAPAMAGAVLAPADGRVVSVERNVTDPFVGPAIQVSIFLSPLDVHVNRAAIGGQVVSVEHRPGEFVPAYKPEASARNEQTSLAVEGERGRVVMRQVAGVLARRIVCRVRPGEMLQAGERFGMIKFGSRMDVLMPAAARVTARVGDRVRAGESVLGVFP